MINEESVHIINKDNILLSPENNTIRIKNAFNELGSPPNMLDIIKDNKTSTLELSKFSSAMTASRGDMIYSFKDRREYTKFKTLLSPILKENETAYTAYKHGRLSVMELRELLREITQEKNPGINVKLVTRDAPQRKAYGWVPLDSKDEISINIRRLDPKLKHLAVQTMYHENEHITQFNSSNVKDYDKWKSLSTSKDSPFYSVMTNPIEEDARVFGKSYGRFNFRWVSNYMKNYDENNWQEAGNKIRREILDFAQQHSDELLNDDMSLKVFWGHTLMKETYPGKKTQAVLRNHIEQEAKRLLPSEYHNNLQDISYNILDTYLAHSNAFNRDANVFTPDVSSLENYIKAYTDEVVKRPQLRQRLRNSSYMYEQNGDRMKKVFNSLENVGSKINEIMFRGGNKANGWMRLFR